MLGSAMMKVAEGGRFAERRAIILEITVELIRAEAQIGGNIGALSDGGLRNLVLRAERVASLIEDAARE